MRETSTTVRIDRRTRERLRRLAAESDRTIAEAVRRLRQERMGDSLATYEPDADDEAWLNGDASGDVHDAAR